MIELALVLDEMGRAAYPGPYFATVVLAAGAIAASGEANQMARYLPDIAAGRTRATLALIEDALSWTPGGGRAARRAAGRRVRAVGHQALRAVCARGGPDPGRGAHVGVGPDGTTVFAVDRRRSGPAQTPNVEMDHTSRTRPSCFDGVSVSAPTR